MENKIPSIEVLSARVDTIDERSRENAVRLNDLSNKVSIISQDISKTPMMVREEVRDELNIHLQKVGEIMDTKIMTSVKEQDYLRLKEKEETAKDYKKHSIKTIIGIVISVMMAAIVPLVIWLFATDNTDKQILLNKYSQQIQDLEDQVEKLEKEADSNG